MYSVNIKRIQHFVPDFRTLVYSICEVLHYNHHKMED